MYYLPKIEELKVGFKCEIYDGDTWKDVILDTPSLSVLDAMVYRGQIRVKHLSADDLDKMGFKYEIGDSDNGFRFSKQNSNGTGLIIVFYPNFKVIHIKFFDTYSDIMATSNCWADQTLYSGTINNANELEFILSRITTDV